jgi:plastocyanin
MARSIVVVAVLGVLVTGQLAFGGSTQATTWNVQVGEQGKPPAGTPKGTTLNQFFPGKLAINAGDKVTFTSFAFHTVTYLGGKPRPPLVLPDPEKGTYEGILDAAGQPFYFNGMPKFVYNGAAFGPYGPRTISGRTPASSGAIFAQSPRKPAQVTFTFPQTGSFKLLCAIHPGMEVSVVVKPRGAGVPSTEAVAARAKAETDAAWAKAKALAAAAVPSGTVTMGIGGKTAILDFLPAVTRVKAGSTVSFVNRSASEVHNVVLGLPKYIRRFGKQTDLFPLGPNAKNQTTPILVYGSDPKPLTFEAGIHGNGFFAGPLTDGTAGGLPAATRITFTSPGRYRFICFIHGPDMAADVVVTK